MTGPRRQVCATDREDEVAEGSERWKLLLTVVEAARRLGIGRTLMYDLLSSGQIESVHVGRLHKVPVEALTSFIDQRKTRVEPLGCAQTAARACGSDGPLE